MTSKKLSMKFNFIPYLLNADKSELKEMIQYLATDNGIDLYKTKLKTDLLGILVSNINLYFFEGSLITVYIHLASKSENFSHVRQILESRIKEEGSVFKIDSADVIGWESTSEFLGLVHDKTGKQLYLYYTLKEFSIYSL